MWNKNLNLKQLQSREKWTLWVGVGLVFAYGQFVKNPPSDTVRRIVIEGLMFSFVFLLVNNLRLAQKIVKLEDRLNEISKGRSPNQTFDPGPRTP
jgi:hypothetical protein